MYAELTPKQVQALPLLAAGVTATDAAKTLKISKGQLSEWRQDLTFLTALEHARREALTAAHDALNHLANDAVRTLCDLLKSAENEHVKLKAAMYVIDRIGVHSLSADPTISPSPSGQVNIDMLMAALTGKPGR